MKKIVISIFVVLIVLWGVIFLIDYSRWSQFKEPIFVVARETADDSMGITRPTNGTDDFYVVGNKVKITYNGMIMESYPAQIFATKIELMK